MELASEERRLLAAVLTHLLGPAGTFPDQHAFRMSNEKDRRAIDALVRRGLLAQGQRYRLTLNGLIALDSSLARALITECVKELEPLRNAYRTQPTREWSVDEFASETAQRPQVVARALSFLQDESPFVTYLADRFGLISRFRLHEFILDLKITAQSPHPSAMVLESLRLRQFRGFTNVEISFPSTVTVIVGVNGAGKSSILDSAALLFSHVAAAIQSQHSRGRRLPESDIQNEANDGAIGLSASIGGKRIVWSLAASRRGFPSEETSSLSQLKDIGAHFQEENAKGRVNLPLAVYYPVNRAPNIPSRIRERHEFDVLAAYDQALEGGGRNFRLFFEWFRDREDLENERRIKSPNFRDSQLAAVRSAVEQSVPGFANLHVRRLPQRMIVEKGGEVLEVDQLSEGEKSLLALVGDLARRLAMANPAAHDPLLSPAVVLIDEIELHLHPGWQRTAIGRLMATFPNCQFVVTTHSPQVLAGVPTENVLLLRRFQKATPTVQTLGRDSNSLLSEVMGTAERPADAIERLGEVAALIDAERTEDAKEALAALARQFGDEDQEVVRLRALLQFLET